ncbi:hypothetical protein E8E11_011508 [Didymella keratinophila]|nr:hypothetical protein E8E11_011508 [Didymella keratinophila]
MDTTPLNPGDSAPSGTQQEPETQVYAQPDKILPEDELYEVRLLTNFLYWTNSLDSEAGVTNEVEAEDGNKIASDILTAWSHSFVRKDELVALTIKDTEEIRVCYEEYNDYPDSDPEDEDDSDDNDIDDVEEDVDPQDNDGEAASFRGKDARIIASNNVRETDRFDQMISRLLYPPLEIKILPSTTKISNEPSMTKWLLSRTTDRLNSDHPKTNIEFQEHIGNVMTLIKNTHQCEWLRMLHALIQTLGPFVKTNLRCIREFYDLKNPVLDEHKTQTQPEPAPEPKGEPASPPTPPVEEKVQAQSPAAPEPLPIRPAPTTPSREGASKDDSTNPLLGKMLDSSPAWVGVELPTAERSDDLADAINRMKVEEKEKRESDDAPEAGKSSWEDTNLGWLDLICLHMSSITTLLGKDSPSPYDERVSKIILNANVSLVKATMSYRDQQLFVKKYIDKFVMDDGKTLTEAQVSKIVEWTKAHGRGLSDRHMNPDSELKMFSGTYHCEIIMLVLYLPERYWDEIVDPEPNVDLEDESKLHLKLPSRRITSTFKDALDVLQVSKRCCPACKALVSHVIARYKANMIYPGNHTQWYPVALPSFTEVGAGRAVISAAKSALQGRFNKILEETQTRNTPAKRYTSPASPTNNIAFNRPTEEKSENQIKKELKTREKQEKKRQKRLYEAEEKAIEEKAKAEAEAKAEADAKMQDAP